MAQNVYADQDARALPDGSLADSGFVDTQTALNHDPAAKQIDTLTLGGGFSAGTLYAWIIDGVAFSYTSVAGDTDQAGVTESVRDQINSEPLFSGTYIATAAAAVVTLTARVAGTGWTSASSTLVTAANTTANAAAAAIPFGRLVIEDGQDAAGQNTLAKLASAANLTAQAVVLTPTAANTTLYEVSVTVGGITYEGSMTSDGSGTATEIVTGLKTSLNALLPAATVIAAGTATLTLTSELAGLTFSYGFGDLWVVTSDTAPDSVDQAALGVTVYSASVEIDDEDNPGYIAHSCMSVLRSGRIRVPTEDLATLASPVFVRLADTAVTGSPLGGFRASAATDCVELDRKHFRWARVLSSTQAVLQLR